MAKLYVISDFHADLYTQYAHPVDDNRYQNTRFKHQMEVLNDILRKSYINDASIVFNGDLFNSRVDINQIVYTGVVSTITNWLPKFKDKGLTMYFLAGNHDQFDNTRTPASSIDVFNEIAGFKDTAVSIDTPEQFNLDDYNLCFVPYSEDIDFLKDKINNSFYIDKDKKNWLFVHSGVEGAVQGKWNHRLGGAFNLSDLRYKEFDEVVLGHYHKRQKLADNVFYVGNTIPLNHNDDGQEKGYYILDTENPPRFVKVESPLFETIDLSNTDLSSEEINESIKNNYVRVITSSKEDLDKLQEESSKNGDNVSIAYKPELKDRTRLDIKEDSGVFDIVKAYSKSKGYSDGVTKIALNVIQDVVEEGNE